MKLNTILANHPGHQPIILYDMSYKHPNKTSPSYGGVFKSGVTCKNICIPRNVTFGYLQHLIRCKEEFLDIQHNEAVIMWCKSQINGRFDQMVSSASLISSSLVDNDGIMRIGIQKETTFGNE